MIACCNGGTRSALFKIKRLGLSENEAERSGGSRLKKLREKGRADCSGTVKSGIM